MLYFTPKFLIDQHVFWTIALVKLLFHIMYKKKGAFAYGNFRESIGKSQEFGKSPTEQYLY